MNIERGWFVHADGGKAELRTIALPELLPHEVRVRVHASGLNRADLLQVKGLYPAPESTPPHLRSALGLEFAGVIEACGSDVHSVDVGDRVMGIVPAGGLSSYVQTPATQLMPVPESKTLQDAAGFSEVFLTAFDALCTEGSRHGLPGQLALKENDFCLVHAVGSGLGTAALQLGLALGYRVIGTSRRDERLKACARLGLQHGVHVGDGQFVGQVRNITGNRGVARILDTVGGAYLGQNLQCLSPCGTLVVLGLLGGANEGQVSTALMVQKRLSIEGRSMRGRSEYEKEQLMKACARQILPMWETGAIKPVVDRVMPADNLMQAIDIMKKSEHLGKIILDWGV